MGHGVNHWWVYRFTKYFSLSKFLSEHVIIHYRFIFVMFLLPVSLVYDLYFYTRLVHYKIYYKRMSQEIIPRSKIVFALSSAPTKHKEKVAGIQKQVREYQTNGEGKGMCTARPGWQTISPQNMEYKNKMYSINVSTRIRCILSMQVQEQDVS